MRRTTALVAIWVLGALPLLSAVPATALGKDAAVFIEGSMRFGTTGSCETDGSGSVSGDGLYFPGVDDHDGQWLFDAATTSGDLLLCGTFGASFPAGIGGACGFHSGDGQGSYVTFKSLQPFMISDLSWVTTVPRPVPVSVPGAGTVLSFNELIVATGTWTQGSTSGAVTLLFEAEGAANCWTTSGATLKLVRGVVGLL